MRETKIIGQGSDESFKAMNMELVVMRTAPMTPIMMPLKVSWSFIPEFCFQLSCIPPGKRGGKTGTKVRQNNGNGKRKEQKAQKERPAIRCRIAGLIIGLLSSYYTRRLATRAKMAQNSGRAA